MREVLSRLVFVLDPDNKIVTMAEEVSALPLRAAELEVVSGSSTGGIEPIQVNSQSGNTAIGYLLARDYDLIIPRRLQVEFSEVVQAMVEATGEKLTSQRIWELFEREYLTTEGTYLYAGHQLSSVRDDSGVEHLTIRLKYRNQGTLLHGDGNGSIDALVDALGLQFDVLSHEQHVIGSGIDARTVAFVEIATPTWATLFGGGLHENSVTATLMAVLSAVNRAFRQGLIDDSMRPASAATD